jgi:2-octaprenylphenol hydroxylase
MSNTPAEFDVVVVGGGLAGLCFAGLLRAATARAGIPLRIALVEAQPPAAIVDDAPVDLRVSAIMPAARAILETLGVWQALPADRVSPYRCMCVWQAKGAAQGARSIRFDAAELGEPELGHITENQAMRRAMWAELESSGGVELLTRGSPASLSESADACELEFDDGSQLRTRLVVGADGANSWVRAQLGVGFRERDYAQSAVVAHVATTQPHAETAWQRFLPGGPVALLPLANGDSSLVWSCPVERAAALVRMDAKEFGAELGAAMDGVLGDIKCVTTRVSFPLTMGYADRYTGTRFALIGDAAHRVHPLAGQGANLGLLDAAALAENLTAHLRRPAADPGDPLVLRRYERARKGDNLVTMGMMDAINRAFTGPLAEVVGLGLEVVDRLPPLKARLARYAMGMRRDLPAAARPARSGE